MKIAKLGEFGMIDEIAADCVYDTSTLEVGIGDDAAVLRPREGYRQLVSCDMLVEGVHFDLSFMSPFALGAKAAAVNLSDIAAMGGRAENLFIALALPRDTDMTFVKGFYDGLKTMAERYKVNIAGGDTVASPGGIVINVTVTGSCEAACICLRSQAQAGDVVAVTGTLGDSAAGLAILQNSSHTGLDFAAVLINRHLLPQPQLEIAARLARHVHAMNDISDGLASESNEIAKASKVSLVLDEAAIPFSDELLRGARWLNKRPIDLALYGGEDYQLVFTLSPQSFSCLKKAGEPITAIGTVENGAGVFLRQGSGKIVKLASKGYNHFE